LKKTTILTTLLITSMTLSSSLLLSTPVFAAPAEENQAAQEKIISDSSKKLASIKEATQKASESTNETTEQLTYIGIKIQKTQTAIQQLEDIHSLGNVHPSENSAENVPLTIEMSSVTLDEDNNDPLKEKKERLAELSQQQQELQTDIKSLKEEQANLHKQEKQLSEKIDQAKQVDTRKAVVAAAKTHLGKPYVYGAAGPDAFDCSGLVQVAFASIGHPLGRTTVDQETAGTTIAVSEAQAGDLVFWGSHGGTYHVGISTGDGSYIHAPVPGDVVQIATVASYAPDFAVRVLS
jgi:cell wall-associated NlpC family hydrolase